ncbi:protein FAM8A1 [Hylaeus volcanicus]|uniref:protein FAM8A1 n=1 Tax=Hylaeus volcanicus TaxID=313075 RepID=UPI0023B82CB4|nr:protein FAM8A1 [Hylaeus volcanicus]XP_053972704.1 protein FAM8A1 [Hylaeus volcanicus]XP_053972705.1 protein FAM8A1 [Hylaeus volcanicus]
MADDKNEDTTEDKSRENKDQPKMTAAEERTEYFKELEKWLYEAYAWQSVAAMFPYYLMSGQIVNPASGVPPFLPQTPNVASTQRLIIGTNDQQNDPLRQRRAQDPIGPPFQPPGAEGLEYRIPPIWKRFAAEFIDLTMFFLLKFSIVFVAIDVFDFIDIDDLRMNLRIDYKMALDMTYGMLVLELINRVIVCILEAIWLQYGVNGRVGGATPGKSMMGLRVIQCRNVTPVDRPNDPDVVLVSPGTDLGLPLALGRSIVKNMILTFLFPVCFGLFFFRFNRTVYDLLCDSIVVEDPHRNLNNNRLHQQ